MSQRQHKKAKAKRKSARDLKNLCIFPENSAKGFGSKSYWVTYLSTRIHPKSCHIIPQKVAITLLSGSRKSAVGA